MHQVRLIAVFLLPVTSFLLGCGSKSSSTSSPPTANIAGADATDASVGKTPAAGVPQVVAGTGSSASGADESKAHLYPEVVIETSLGNIKLRLDMEHARMTVDNFLSNYVDRGFYGGTVFHHVEKGFMIIGGGYTADGTAKPTRTPIHNEAHRGLKNRRGTIAMARDAAYADSATSQFFINLTDNPFLDFSEQAEKTEFGYCVFGEVVEGMDVVDRIAQVPVKEEGVFPKLPTEPVVIQGIKRR